ncbi:MAG: ABC transporter substrate-binding protein [Prolixibacteraceae bacterium]|nr:ABC transporter substrate-binding protein [Prolixibacteraceae bacterium]
MKLIKIVRAFFALFIIAVVLLLLDLDNREAKSKKEHFDIAIFKIASRLILDQTEQGIIDGLKEGGFVNGKNCTIKSFSAEGDMPTANMIGQNIVSSGFDMVITASTPALQVMANANREGKVMHVFCTVTDPYGAGVGITGPEPDQHPPHLVGIGTFQPVEEAFEIARKMDPSLKRVGTVWCTSEVCSEACLKLARKKCSELGIELLESGIESSTQILEAAMGLTLRGVDALWLGGDNVVESGIDQLINAANRAKIPLFTNNPYNVHGNALFGLGAEYYQVGKIAGTLAGDILKGKPTSEIGVKNVVPNYLKLNPDALKNMKRQWDLSGFKGEK